MSTVHTGKMTADQFWQWCQRPENQDQIYELDQGVVIEMPSAGGRHGLICSLVGHLLWQYVNQRGSGWVAGNDTGLLVAHDPDTVRGPDVMLFSHTPGPDQVPIRFVEDTPALTVEVLSPTDNWTRMQRKVNQYLLRGVGLVWVIDPDMRAVTVFRRGEMPQVLTEQDDLTGNGVLPDLRLPVAELFRFLVAPTST